MSSRAIPQRLRSEEIYDAILNEDWFAEFPSAVARSFGARSCNMLWQFADGTTSILCNSGYFTDEQLEIYMDDFADKDLWAQRALTPDRVNRAQNCEEFVSPSEYSRSEFYNEWVRAIGDDTFHCMGMMLRTDWGTGLIGLQKGRSQTGFDDDAVLAFQQDSVHIRKMLAIRSRLAALQHDRQQKDLTLDLLGRAIFTVAADGTLLGANATAEALLTDGDVLLVGKGRLQARSPFQDKKLRSAIAQASAPANPEASALVLHGRDGSPYHLTAVAIRTHGARRQVLVMVGARDPDHSLESRLRLLFGLSPAEAELAVRIAAGADLGEIAAERNVAISTARSQMKAILAKMDCRRQAEVVAVVKSLPPLNLSV